MNTLQELAEKAFPISEAPDIFETTSQMDKREGFLAGAEHSLAGLVEALEKYGQHLHSCNLNQDWIEADQAMADTPNEFRDEGYYIAVEEMHDKRKKCTCGFTDALAKVKNINNE